MNYGKGILSVRTSAGISKRQLAIRAKLHPSYITHLEAERKKPSLDALEAIANALGVSIQVLMLSSADEPDLSGIDPGIAAQLAAQLHRLTLSANED